jgi:hypothetical protein
MKISFGIGKAGVLVKIETKDLTDTSLEHYSQTNLFSLLACIILKFALMLLQKNTMRTS